MRRFALRVKETEGGAVALVKEKMAAAGKTVKSRSLSANLAALFSGVRERLELVVEPPAILRGIPITVITALLMLLALSGFVGVRL